MPKMVSISRAGFACLVFLSLLLVDVSCSLLAAPFYSDPGFIFRGTVSSRVSLVVGPAILLATLVAALSGIFALIHLVVALRSTKSTPKQSF